ncbi:MAG: CubicO group peptidase (beta-lactamase class C family) [Polaribacter sp.]
MEQSRKEYSLKIKLMTNTKKSILKIFQSNLLAITCLLLFATSAVGQGYEDSLTAQLTRLHQKSDLPGFAVAIVSKQKVMYQNGFGYSDLATKTPYTTETLQNVGSISKTFIAFALMKLVEEGKLKLDDNIEDYLSFKITNPYFPNNKVTIRQLATHTSSLTDGKDEMLIEKSYLLHEKTSFTREELPKGYFECFELYNTNEPMSMKQFLYNTYCKEGDWYSQDNFLNTPPGTIYEYTNIGATLLAYIIEGVAEEPFDQFIQKSVLQPLSMNESAWSWSGIDSASNRITHYLPNNLAVPSYDLITYPDGGFITNISEFTHYLREMIKGLNGESELLKQEFYKEMMSNQLTKEYFPSADFLRPRGLLWTSNKEGDNISANGAGPGVTTTCMLTTGGNIGYVFFINKSIYDNEKGEQAFREIRQLLIKYAGKIRRE